MESINQNFDAICIGGGGIKGVLALGCLYYYHQKGLYNYNDAQIYIGTSIGSVIALLLVCGYTPFELFVEVCNVEEIVDMANISDLKCIMEKFGALSINILTDKIKPLIRKKLGVTKMPTLQQLFERTGKTLIITASNVTDIKCEYFSHKTYPDISCTKPIKFSCSMPGVFQRIQFNGKYYVDGAICDNLPIKYIDDGKMKILAIINSGSASHLQSEDCDSFSGYLYRLVSLFTRSNTELRCQMANDNTTLIKMVYDKVTPFSFNIAKDEKMDMFFHGYKTAENFKQLNYILL